jgi:predicted phosphodiesterase
MRLWILSDLHLEQSVWQPPTDMKGRADVVVLAGDIHNPLTRSIAWAASHMAPGCAFDGMEVLLVPGNHEYYRRDIEEQALAARHAAKDAGVHLLDGHESLIGGVRFLGITLWTNYLLYGDSEVAMQAATQGINDHRLISFKGGRFAPYDAMKQHFRELHWLEDQIALRPFAGPTVVVTHHCVSKKSVHSRWGETPISAAFASNLDAFVAASGAALWIHGHTHDSFDYMLGATRVVCNPKGYGPSVLGGIPENTVFDERLVIEIDGGPDAG